jgi:hypothetical protein
VAERMGMLEVRCMVMMAGGGGMWCVVWSGVCKSGRKGGRERWMV